jgi:hypothetical protein
MTEKIAVTNEKEKESGTTAPAEAPVVPVQEKYAKLAEPPVRYKESRVKLKRYQFPGSEGAQTGRGGLPPKANGSDGLPLLVDVPSRGKTQKLHRLAAKRLAAMNEKWIREHPGEEVLKVASGWRGAAFSDFGKYHAWCRDRSYWLSAKKFPHGTATLTAAYPGDSKKRPTPQEPNKGSCAVAKAYNSPHETGLAIDFGNNGLKPVMATNKEQKKTVAFEWIVDNAHLFGITPYVKEAWHWEVQMPVEAWITGVDWAEGENYAVRIKGPGKTGKLPPGFGSGVAGGPCPARGLVGSPAGTGPDLTTWAVMTPELDGVKAGARFPDQYLGANRELSEITGLIIHETGGGFGQVKSSGEGGKDPRAIKSLAAEGFSTHFTISRTGQIKQHAPLGNRTKASGPVNAATVAVDLVNPPIQSSSEKKKKFVNKSEKETAYPILDQGFMRTGHLLNTPAQCEALWQLIKKVQGKASNFPIQFPCSAGEGGFAPAKATGYKNPGIIAHQRFNHADGVFAEYYCLARSKGIQKMKAWYAAAGAASKRGSKEAIPLPSPSNAATLAALGKEKLKETREKYKESPKPVSAAEPTP